MLLDQELFLVNIQQFIWKLLIIQLAQNEVRKECMMPRVMNFEIEILEVSLEDSSDLELEHIMQT